MLRLNRLFDQATPPEGPTTEMGCRPPILYRTKRSVGKEDVVPLEILRFRKPRNDPSKNAKMVRRSPMMAMRFTA